MYTNDKFRCIQIHTKETLVGGEGTETAAMKRKKASVWISYSSPLIRVDKEWQIISW